MFKSAGIRYAPFALTLLIGILIGFAFRAGLSQRKPEYKHFTVRLSGFQYINPLLECESISDTAENKQLKPIKSRVEDFISKDLRSKSATNVAVYLRELISGQWFSVGSTENFFPASLLKVPIMMAFLKEAESNPQILKKKVKYEGSIDYNLVQHFKPSDTMKRGASYTVDELLYRMIVYSDNNASALLENMENPDLLKRVYNDLLMESPFTGKQEYSLPVHLYASFFRVLYNASYLDRQMSEKALEYLANSEFKDGLVAGVPSNILVAHKFGERAFGDNKGKKQLHDCGIIYYPKHPYLLCVMTEGNSFELLDDVIRDISRVVYEEISTQHW